MPILIHGGRGLPPIADEPGRPRRPLRRRAADHRPLRDRRPGGARRPLLGPSERLLRHLRVEPARHPRPLPARRARAGALRLRLPVRPAAGVAAPRAADRAGGRPRRGAAAGGARRAARDGSAAARSRCRSRRRAARESISQPLTFARIHAVPLDGDAAPLDAPGRHDRRARARPERLRRALERPPRGDGADPRAARDRPRAVAHVPGDRGRAATACGRRAPRSGCSTWRTSWR